MLPADITQWLQRSPLYRPGWRRTPAEREAICRQFSALGIPATDEICVFYLENSACTVRGWYQLNEVSQIAVSTAFARRELSVSSDFIALTGIEGSGMTLYHRTTGQVFDVELGQFEALASGELPPIASSFVEYLRWCKAKEEENAP